MQPAARDKLQPRALASNATGTATQGRTVMRRFAQEVA